MNSRVWLPALNSSIVCGGRMYRVARPYYVDKTDGKEYVLAIPRTPRPGDSYLIALPFDDVELENNPALENLRQSQKRGGKVAKAPVPKPPKAEHTRQSGDALDDTLDDSDSDKGKGNSRTRARAAKDVVAGALSDTLGQLVSSVYRDLDQRPPMSLILVLALVALVLAVIIWFG